MYWPVMYMYVCYRDTLFNIAQIIINNCSVRICGQLPLGLCSGTSVVHCPPVLPDLCRMIGHCLQCNGEAKEGGEDEEGWEGRGGGKDA